MPDRLNNPSNASEPAQMPGRYSSTSTSSFGSGSAGTPSSGTPDKELDRVRDLILGPDPVQSRFRRPEVDRLREILFGQQTEDYDRRFTDLQRDAERMMSDVRKLQDMMVDFEKTQARRVDALEREVRRQMTELRRVSEQIQSQQVMYQQVVSQNHQQDIATQTVRQQIKDQTIKLSEHEKNLRDTRELLESYRDQSDRKLNAAQIEIRQTENKLYEELRRFVDRLNQQKTDRKSLAAMFIEIGTRLETGGSMAELLEDLTSTGE